MNISRVSDMVWTPERILTFGFMFYDTRVWHSVSSFDNNPWANVNRTRAPGDIRQSVFRRLVEFIWRSFKRSETERREGRGMRVDGEEWEGWWLRNETGIISRDVRHMLLGLMLCGQCPILVTLDTTLYFTLSLNLDLNLKSKLNPNPNTTPNLKPNYNINAYP